jgi:hypothetical protein
VIVVPAFSEGKEPDEEIAAAIVADLRVALLVAVAIRLQQPRRLRCDRNYRLAFYEAARGKQRRSLITNPGELGALGPQPRSGSFVLRLSGRLHKAASIKITAAGFSDFG